MSYTSHNGFDQRLNVKADQAVSIPRGSKHEYMTSPSTSTAAWGSQFSIQFRQKSLELDKMILEFNMPAISATVTSSGSIAYTSAFFWWTKIDVVIGAVVVDTIYPLTNFLNYNTFVEGDERRTQINTAAGMYNNHSTRATKSASSGYWYVPLQTAFNPNDYPLLEGYADVELRITMDSLSNQYTLSAGTASSITGAITAVNLITKQTKLPASVLNYTTSTLRRAQALHYPFLETRTQTFTVASGVSSTSLVLSGLTGLCPYFFFTVRSTSPTGSSQWTFDSTVTQWELLSGSSENIVGGQPLKDIQSRLVLAADWTMTTFLNEVGTGCYLYSFAKYPREVRETGANLTAYSLKGNEVLKITWSTALTANSQIDVYCPCHAALELTTNQTKKISLTASA